MKKQALVVAAKPQYTRREVLDFLDRVKAKAIKTVKDEYENRYDLLFNDLIDQDEELNALIDNSVDLVANLSRVSERIAVIVKDGWEKKGSYYSGNFTKANGINLIAEISENYVDKTGRLQAVKTEQTTKIKEIEDTYRAVEYNVKSMTSPAKMRAYLDSLGFDTAYLDRIIKAPITVIDPAKLFPCKERGLLEG